MKQENNEHLDNIYTQIKGLEEEKKNILDIIKEYEKKLYKINYNIKSLTQEFPRCYSCLKNNHPKNMVIATQEDIDDYYDRNEGYSGPEIGEYYCGC